MKFLVDVNIPQSVTTYLREQNHDVKDLKQDNLSATDIEIIKLAQKEGMIILTKDKDFTVLTQYPQHQVPTIVIRLKNQLPQHMVEKLSDLLKNQSEEILSNALTLVREESADSYPF